MRDLELNLQGVDPTPPEDLARRLWARDSSAWGPGDDDPADRLGWLTLPGDFGARAASIERFARSFADGMEAVVLLGMGGSSLAPEVLSDALGSNGPELVVGDGTHPAQIRADDERIELSRAAFVVSSKSGGTIETLSLYRHYRSAVDDGKRFVAITDPGTSLEALAQREGFRETFLNPPDIGGRYSALSYFGLVPAALCGVELGPVLDAAAAMADRCGADVAGAANPGVLLGAAIGRLAMAGRDKLTFLVSDPIAGFGDWVEQLIAESTGKHDTGIVPIVREPLADASAYADDRAFVVLRLRDDAGTERNGDELARAGHPVISIVVDDATDIGGQMFLWEVATAVAGSLLGINAFDQPNVEAAKKASRELLESGEELKWADDDPEELVDDARPGDVVALCAFAPRAPAAAQTLSRARSKILREHGVATMAGFGPRYLHSTGQLHKGGPPGVRALVILDEPDEDVPIPGSQHGFARLVTAQAAGDARALAAAHRKVVTTSWATFESWTEA